MMSLVSLFGLVLALIPGLVAAEASQSMRIATYNLRYDSMPDNITVQQSLASLPDPLQQYPFFGKTGEQPWSTRRIKVWENLESEGVVLAGFQEALVRQVTDLATLLGDGWGWVGVGRDDGVAAGEFSPIFYKKYGPSPLAPSIARVSLANLQIRRHSRQQRLVLALVSTRHARSPNGLADPSNTETRRMCLPSSQGPARSGSAPRPISSCIPALESPSTSRT
ncbi:hypothetical protein NUW54_g11142 [Trametes sanguinea]|uniref:Uncharacterized protein n=1 Tax=Trametes sanguinea TaxID=158606 RepID=A0ACC1NKK0_9APHY|nr:hypothetical protein NUW54_g11142 [Trametes sanguinea]